MSQASSKKPSESKELAIAKENSRQEKTQNSQRLGASGSERFVNSSQGDPNPEQVFLTAINSHKEGEIDPETVMLNINLQSLIDEIDEHFIRTLEMHENDFKLAYRGQMLKVKREL